MERLAESDECEVVKQVQEVYADYYVLHSNHASLQLDSVVGEQLNSWNARMLTRCCDSLASLLLSMRKRPLIRYDQSSLMAIKLAHEMRDLMDRESSLYDFRRPDSSPILLILDRRFDLVTPLLLQWTYQSMLHDLFGTRNGRLSLEHDALTSEEKGNNHEGTEHVLCVEQDSFYRDNVDSTFGDLGENVRTLVKTFQERTQQHQSQIESIPSMKRFIEEYPEYKKMSLYVAKHVALAGEISKRVENLHLLQISEVEQEIASSPSTVSLVEFVEILRRPNIAHPLKVKLALVYALRQFQSPSFNFLNFTDLLQSCEFTPDDISLIDFAVNFSLPDVEAPRESGFTMSALRGRGTAVLSNKVLFKVSIYFLGQYKCVYTTRATAGRYC